MEIPGNMTVLLHAIKICNYFDQFRFKLSKILPQKWKNKFRVNFNFPAFTRINLY